MTMRLYYKLVGSDTGDADFVIDSDGTVIKDRQGMLAELAEQAWRYRDLQS